MSRKDARKRYHQANKQAKNVEHKVEELEKKLLSLEATIDVTEKKVRKAGRSADTAILCMDYNRRQTSMDWEEASNCAKRYKDIIKFNAACGCVLLIALLANCIW